MSVSKKNEKYYCRFQINGERHHYLCNGAKSMKEAKLIEDGFRYKTPESERVGYLFVNPNTGKPYTDIKKAWHTALKEAKIENFRFHDLRHTVGTRLAKANVPVNVIK